MKCRDAETLDEPGVVDPGTGRARPTALGSPNSVRTVPPSSPSLTTPAGRLFAERRRDGAPDLDARGRRLRARPARTCPPTDASAVAVDFDSLRLRAWDITTGRRIGDVTIADVPDVARWRSVCRRSRSSAPTGSTSTYRPTSASCASASRTWNRSPTCPCPDRSSSARSSSVPESDEVVAVGTGGELVRVDMVTAKVVAVGRSADPSTLAWAGVSPDGSLGGRVPRVLVPARVVRRAARSSPSASPSPSATSSSTRRSRATADTSRPTGSSSGSTTGTSTPTSGKTKRASAAGRNLTAEEWRTFIGADEPYAATCPNWPGADGTGSTD